MMNLIIRLPEVLRLTGLVRSTIYRKIADDTFPRRVRLGVRAVGWGEAEVQTGLESLRHERKNS